VQLQCHGDRADFFAQLRLSALYTVERVSPVNANLRANFSVLFPAVRFGGGAERSPVYSAATVRKLKLDLREKRSLQEKLLTAYLNRDSTCLKIPAIRKRRQSTHPPCGLIRASAARLYDLQGTPSAWSKAGSAWTIPLR
jgi:hypothetical protein